MRPSSLRLPRAAHLARAEASAGGSRPESTMRVTSRTKQLP